ncbi:MAG: threonine--tRNA ligase [Armatimonadota bacterium]|nr:threonine--tRNA ligase [Armatimonadota bacterium]
MGQVIVELPDGTRHQVAAGSTLRDLAERLGVRHALAAFVDGRLRDLSAAVREDARVEFVTFNEPAGREVYWHSTAHLMAQAVKQLFPEAKLAIGPPIEDGFYYDFDIGRPFSPEDLERIEARMRELAARDQPIERVEIPRDEVRRMYEEQGEVYKLELLEDIPDERVSFYRQDGFADMCRGPHLPSTGHIRAIKLLATSGAYWRGDERRPMLQRIYGVSYPTQEQLDAHLHRLEEARRRDHRKLGPQLGLFMFHETAPGMPYWLPRGLIVLNEMIAFWRAEHERRGYQEIRSPLVNKQELYERSGHWEHFRDSMFIMSTPDEEVYALKPMNCPNAMVVFASRTRSYRDLPLRLSDTDILHRFERSGTLYGLLRVREFSQDDAHIFVAEDQIKEEYREILAITERFYSVFDIEYRLRLSTRPEKFMGDPAVWDRAERELREILESSGRPYEVAGGEGAFYGPKIDILMKDSLGREWQTGTIQLDFQMPRRFGLTYHDRDGQEKTPAVIHRVIYGSLERFIGILVEHYAGALPVWLSPEHVRVLPIADRHHDYARRIRERLLGAGLRATVDDSNDRISYKVRQAQVEHVPYMAIVGDREVGAGTVAVRSRSAGDLGPMPLEQFMARVQGEVAARV